MHSIASIQFPHILLIESSKQICAKYLKMNRRFRDRAEAGRKLSEQLLTYALNPQAIVLGLPRGGVPVAYPIAQTLQLPLDICLVHKLGVPGDPEVAMGAIDLQGRRYLNDRIVSALRISAASIDRVAEIELRELQRRDQVYRGDRPEVDLRERIVIVVDDGLATGATMTAAIQVIKQQQPAQIVVAVPVAFRDVVDRLTELVDLFVCLMMPAPFSAIGSWYDNFDQTTDAQICTLLDRGIS
jgi:putative phosphoribosyl transferase